MKKKYLNGISLVELKEEPTETVNPETLDEIIHTDFLMSAKRKSNESGEPNEVQTKK